MLIQIPQPKPYIHPGPTVQRTDPVPPVSQPDRARYVDLQQTRYLLGARVDIHQGATRQQTYLFPPNQPEPARTLARAQAPLFEPPSTQAFYRSADQGPTKLATFPVPPAGVVPASWFWWSSPAFLDVNARLTGPRPQVDPVPTVQTIPIPGVTQRADTWFGRTAAVFVDDRWRVGPRQALDQGATILSTDPIPPVLQRPNWWFGPTSAVVLDARRMTGPSPQFAGVTSQQTYIFPTGQPELSYQIPRQWFRAFTGPTAQVLGPFVTVAQLYEFKVSQPELIACARREALRFTVGTRAQLDQGALVQQTYEFKVSQPELAGFGRLDSSRWQMPTRGAAEGLPPFTHVFSPAQPVFHYYVRVTPAPALRPIEGPTSQQTSIFPTNQPELIGFNALQRVRLLGGPVPQFAGSTTQQTFIFPPNQPELIAFVRREFARRLGGSVAWPLESIVVFSTATADYIIHVRADDAVIRVRRDDVVQELGADDDRVKP